MKKTYRIFSFFFITLLFFLSCAFRDNRNDPLSPYFSKETMYKPVISSLEIGYDTLIDTVIDSLFFDTLFNAHFHVSAIDPDDDITDFNWFFDDSISYATRVDTMQFRYVYGKHTVEVIVIDSLRYADTIADIFGGP